MNQTDTLTTKRWSKRLGVLFASALGLISLGSSAQTTFNFTGVLQYYTVPVGVTSIHIDAQGAQGGSITIACPATGGLGARMEGDVTVTPGEVLTVLVGGQGQTQGEDGGGGGGSFVVRTGNIPLVVAGGGGGATNNIQICTGLRNGVNASITTSGTASANGLIAGGTAGNGGGANVGSGCGGGGFYTDGAYAANANGRGVAFVNGGAGGIGQNNNHGGFGGGGCGWYNGGNGGGGGGYSGGGTDGNYPSTYFGGGGGGGSYNIGTNQVNTAGFKTGNGLVVITPLAQSGAALNFDGTNDYVSIGSPLTSGSSYTKEAWIYLTNSNANRSIVSSASAQFYMLGGNVYAGHGSNLTAVMDPATVVTNVWVHYAVSYDATTSTMKLYKNGVLVATNTTTPAFVAGPTFIGSSDGTTNFLAGNIDEVRVWNRVLCDAEIQNNRTCEIATTSNGLVRNYHFNQGTASAVNTGITSLTDVSVSASNGTLTGFTLSGNTSNWIAPGGVTSGVSCAAFVNTITGTLSAQTNVSCNGGSNGSATIAATGAGPYTYSWSPSGGNASTATGLTVGTYTCSISNPCGGLTTVTVSITQPAVLAATISSTSISCFGGANGTATANPTGGTAPYTYAWSNGGTSQTISGLNAGVYTCTVTCTNGCVTTQSVTITQPTVLAATTMQNNVSCNGGSNGDAMVMVTGGTPSYQYAWLPSGGNAAMASGLSAGTYTCTVTDGNGCSLTQTVLITAPTPVTATSTATPILCNGGGTYVTVVGAGGVGPYSGTGTFSASAGTLSYTVTDANGCSATTTITVTEPDPIVLSVTQNNVSCNGNTDGSIDLTVNGGTGPYSYSWNAGQFTTQDITNVGAGSYNGVVTDANGCMDSTLVTITQPTVLVATTSSVTMPSTCVGLDGAVNITVSGGTPGYNFLWSNSATTEDLSGVGAGVYTCMITDANGCLTQLAATLADPNPPTVSVALAFATVCVGDGIYTLSGGSPAGGTYSGPGVIGLSFNPATAGVGTHTITYTYTDSQTLCSATGSDIVIVSACVGITPVAANAPQFNVFPNPNNGSFLLQLNATEAADVLIFDALGKLVSTQQVQPNVQQAIQLENAGMYTITVVAADGARSSQRVIVTK